MSLKNYGVLKAKPIKTVMARNEAHLEIHLKADGQDYIECN